MNSLSNIHQQISKVSCRLRSGLKAAGSAATRFLREKSGNVAMIFGIASIPLAIAGGAAVDYSRAYLVQQRLSAALDAAALAVGASAKTDDTELRQLAQNYFDANYPASEIGVPGQLAITIANSTVSMSATADLQTAIMGLVGIHNMSVSSAVEITKERTALEVVLVLDNTGSMNSYGKIDALKQASTDLVDVMFGDDPNPELLKFALVPFASTVNVGAQYLNSGWIDINGLNSLHGIQFETGDRNVMAQYAKLTNKQWNGCVEARPAPYDTLDTPPSVANGDTLWVPYFAPDEPDRDAAQRVGYWYGNSYMSDRFPWRNRNMDERQRDTDKYTNRSVSSDGPYFNCKNRPIQPLTNSKATILNAINLMSASGSTTIPIGLAWGWRVISPGSPFTQGAAYDNEEVKKVIILLTDGENFIGNLSNHNRSWYTGYGYASQARLGTTNSSAALDEVNSRTSQICENIKARDILLYTITFQVGSSSTRTLMRNCASTPAMYFDSPSNAQLRENFREIAKALGKLRISR